MSLKALLGALLLLLAPVPALQAQVRVPDTPAGRTLDRWLEAFDSGDRARIEDYVRTVDSGQSVDEMISFRNRTGGFDLQSIEVSEPLHLRFRVRERGTRNSAVGNLVVAEGVPPRVESFTLRALPAGVVFENVILDRAMRSRVIEGVDADLTEYYIDAAVARQMEAELETREKAGDYDRITDGDAFALTLTRDLRAVSHDPHLRVDFSPFKMTGGGDPAPEDVERVRRQMERDNCAFERVEILPGNIGYIRFDAFMDAGFCGPTVVAAMGFVAHADALIFDVRQNRGGQPAMVTLMASYLFDQPTHLIDIYSRKEDQTRQSWTLPYLPGARLVRQPVFILTSSQTFSGAEEFAFDLKNQRRATIVGETTGGGAHPVSGHPVADYFMIGVPFARSVDPVTGTNWEGTGVVPDVKVPAARALETAQRLAREKIQGQGEGSPE